MRILVTGGAGFIGCNLVRMLIEQSPHEVLNVDKLTYAGNLQSLDALDGNPRYRFRQLDIAEAPAITRAIDEFRPDWILHLAAESHVDRSIDGPGAFIQTNIVGTYTLLQAARGYYEGLSGGARDRFRFLHVSTDEVYGSLAGGDPAFTETTPYDPHSPYSASKAASDHLARAWQHTYGLPVLVTNCSNNYGPFQFPEKLIPVVILNAISGRPIPVYGKGENVRDWLYVDDHARALLTVMERGRVGQTYNIGGDNEQKNIDLVRGICSLLDELYPTSENGDFQSVAPGKRSYGELIAFVTDRPGHDLRYAIDASKIRGELDWSPREDFSSGFGRTIRWYLENEEWWRAILAGEYRLTRQGLVDRNVG